MTQSQTQLDAFKQVALGQGYDPKEVDSFLNLAQAKSSQPYDPSSDTTLLRQEAFDQYKQKQGQAAGDLTDIEQKAVSAGAAKIAFDPVSKQYKVVPSDTSGVDPMQYVADNQATKYLTGKDKDARTAQAEAIQKIGVDKYLQTAALPDLLNDKEVIARDSATSLLNSASAIYGEVQDRSGNAANIQGVGPLGQFRPGFLTDQAGKTLKQDITNLTAEKMKEISGSAISDNEVKRLSKALPQVGDTESVIMTKAKNIADSVEIGLQMQEAAKRERLTLDQAYQKYGASSFQQHNQPIPDWIGKSSKPGLNVGNTNSTQVGRFQIQVQ